MSFIITSRTRAVGNRAPVGNFSLDRGSLQAKDLLMWLPWEGAGNTAKDYSGNNHNVTFESGDLRQRSVNGDLVIDASTYDGLNTTLPATTTSTITRTYCAWIKVVSTTQDAYVWDHNNGNDLALIHGYQDGNFNVYSYPTGSAAATQFSDGGAGWHHVAVSSSSTAFKAYLDGVNQVDVSDSGITTLGGIRFGSSYLGGDHFDGLIGDFRVYDRVLSDAEVYAQWDPRTRWELRYQPRRTYFMPSAAFAITLGAPKSVDRSTPSATVGSITSDTAGGTLYWIAQPDGTTDAPTPTEIKAGQNGDSGAATHSGTI